MGCGILRRFASIELSLTEVNCGSLPLGILFLFRPTPSRRLSPACGPQIIPRPQVGGRADRYRFTCGRRRRDPPASNHISFAHSLRSFSIARFLGATVCPLLLASVRPYSIPTASAHLRRLVPRPAAQYGKRGEDFVSPVPRSPPASIDIGKAGRGCRIAGFSPSRLFCLSCLLAAFSFPYKPGMVMGYSVATVIYFS